MSAVKYKCLLITNKKKVIAAVEAEMDEEKYNTIFNAINKLDNVMDQIVAKNVSRKK